MKIIDFEKKGNVVRFYLGDDNCNDYWGDDWNDAPYEHNAGTVYDQYIKKYVDIFFPFDSLVLEPSDNWRDMWYSKEDMKNHVVPCIIAIPKTVRGDDWNDSFSYWVGSREIYKVYFDEDEPNLELLPYVAMVDMVPDEED